MKGLFITFEGGEGSGKTTLVQGLFEKLSQRGYSLLKTREPGSSKLSEQIREWLLSSKKGDFIGQKAELLLFLAARAQNIEETILPALKEGKIVLCDRYHDSSIAYQGKARGLGIDRVEKMCSFASENLWPDLTFYLNISPEAALSRIKTAEECVLDRIESESLDFHRQVQEGYDYLLHKYPKRFFSLDAHLSQEEVLQIAFGKVEQRLLEVVNR